MRTRPQRALAVALAPAFLVVTACDPPLPAGTAPTGECESDPFTPEFQANNDAVRANSHHVTASVFDDRTRCWYHLRHGQVMTTASVVKVEVMAATTLRAMTQGRALTRSELAWITPMIRSSDNETASALWGDLGGVNAMAGYGNLMGLTETVETAPTWGLTRWSTTWRKPSTSTCQRPDSTATVA